MLKRLKYRLAICFIILKSPVIMVTRSYHSNGKLNWIIESVIAK